MSEFWFGWEERGRRERERNSRRRRRRRRKCHHFFGFGFFCLFFQCQCGRFWEEWNLEEQEEEEEEEEDLFWGEIKRLELLELKKEKKKEDCWCGFLNEGHPWGRRVVIALVQTSIPLGSGAAKGKSMVSYYNSLSSMFNNPAQPHPVARHAPPNPAAAMAAAQVTKHPLEFLLLLLLLLLTYLYILYILLTYTCYSILNNVYLIFNIFYSIFNISYSNFLIFNTCYSNFSMLLTCYSILNNFYSIFNVQYFLFIV